MAEEVKKPEIVAISLMVDINQDQMFLELQIDPQKLAIFANDVQFLDAQKNDVLLGINNKLLIGKSIAEIHGLLGEFNKHGKLITFLYIRRESFNHSSVAKLTQVIKVEIILVASNRNHGFSLFSPSTDIRIAKSYKIRWLLCDLSPFFPPRKPAAIG